MHARPSVLSSFLPSFSERVGAPTYAAREARKMRAVHAVKRPTTGRSSPVACPPALLDARATNDVGWIRSTTAAPIGGGQPSLLRWLVGWLIGRSVRAPLAAAAAFSYDDITSCVSRTYACTYTYVRCRRAASRAEPSCRRPHEREEAPLRNRATYATIALWLTYTSV